LRFAFQEARIDISALFSLGLHSYFVEGHVLSFVSSTAALHSKTVLRRDLEPGKMPPSQNAANKKPRMTLAQVSAYDDILTDALVDHVSCL
jgi:hypothetical protein